MARFRKRPVEIEAVVWTGQNIEDVMALGADGVRIVRTDGNALVVQTLEGEMRARVGDWIIRGVKGEIYPCKPDIFDASYEPV